jgi:hypothetical protein
MKERIEERQLQGWRFIERFLEVLNRVRAGLPLSAREQHGLRELHAEPYLGLFLFGLFNPIVDSMRGLCRASELPRVQAEISHGVVALSRFSEAQHVFLEGGPAHAMGHLAPPACRAARLAPASQIAGLG